MLMRKRVFQCKHCDALFTTTNKLIDHAYNFHTDGSHTCTFCGRQTSSQMHLRNHMRVVHQGSLGIVVENHTNGDMKKQRLGHNVEGVQMDFSEIKSEDISQKEGLEIPTASRQKKFQCQKCSQSFVSVFYLNQHMEKTHNTNVDTVLIRPSVNIYKCEFCYRVFNKSHFLQMHMESHHAFINTVLVRDGVKLHKCEFCSKVFDTESALESHGPSCRFSSVRKKEASDRTASDLMHHKQHIDKIQKANVKVVPVRQIVVHKCEYCSKVFHDRPSLQTHRKTHTYQCPSCDFSCHDQQRLKKHMMTHVPNKPNKPLKCETCQSVFKTKVKYQAHMLIHGTGLLNLPCTKCHKVFSQKTSLNAHMKVHQLEESGHSSPTEKPMEEGKQGPSDRMVTVIKDVQGQITPIGGQKTELPYKCEDCNLSFRCQFSLKNHALVHKAEKAHQCMKCRRYFKTMEDLCEHTEDHCRDKPKKGEYYLQ